MDYKQYCEVKYEFRRKTYIEQQVDNRSKTTLVSYLLWFFLGGFGAHRFIMVKLVLQLDC